MYEIWTGLEQLLCVFVCLFVDSCVFVVFLFCLSVDSAACGKLAPALCVLPVKVKDEGKSKEKFPSR